MRSALKKEYNLYFHQAVMNSCYVNGQPYTYRSRDHLKPIYDTPHNFVLLKSARKTEKSTFLSNKLTLNCCKFNNFEAMYVAPRNDQVSDFSNTRLKPVIKQSPAISQMQTTSCFDNVTFKTFINFSSIILRSCWISPDALRGPAAEMLCIDEIQDIIYDNVPVALEVLSGESREEPGRPKKLKLFTGTPKTFDNTIQHYWDLSTQNEWMVKCTACNNYNLLDISNIGLNGTICSKKGCGKPIDPQNGIWVSFNPHGNIVGFRLNQLMLAWTDWTDLKVKMDTYSEAKFNNEVLGLSYDAGSKPITKEEIQACCTQRPFIYKREKNVTGNIPLFMGVDWGTGQENASYTVLVIGGYLRPQEFYIFFAKRYEGRLAEDPDALKADVALYSSYFDTALIGADWGFGHFMNKSLKKIIKNEMLAEIYCHGTTQQKLRYDKKTNKFIANKDEWYGDILLDIKIRKMNFPRWEEWEKPFAQDIYGIVQSVDKRGKAYFDRNPSNPIDTLSAIVNAVIASRIYFGYNKFITG